MRKNIKVAQKNIEIIDSKEASSYINNEVIFCPECQFKNVIKNYHKNIPYICQNCKSEL